MSDAPIEGPRKEDLEGFSANDIEFIYEHGVGLTVIAYKPEPWLSWEETQALARWLAGNVWKLPPA